MDCNNILEQIKRQNEDDIEIIPEVDIQMIMDIVFWQDESVIDADWKGAIEQQDHDRLLENYMASYNRNVKEVRMQRFCKVQRINTKFQGYSQVNWLRMG